MALVLTTGVALAQTTTSSQTTTTVTPAEVPLIVAPPAGTLSVTHTEKSVSSDGSTVDKTQTTYRNTNGVADDTMTKTTTTAAPTVALSTTTTSKSSTSTTTD
jgi:hypothetical protein